MTHRKKIVNKRFQIPEKIYINPAALEKPVLSKRKLVEALSCWNRPVDRKLLGYYVSKSTAARYASKESSYQESHSVPLPVGYLSLFKHKNPLVIWMLLRIALAGDRGFSLGKLKKLTGKSKHQIKRALKRQKVCFVYLQGHLLTVNVQRKEKGLFCKDYKTGKLIPVHGTKASIAACARARAVKATKIVVLPIKEFCYNNFKQTYYADMAWDLKQKVINDSRAKYAIPMPILKL